MKKIILAALALIVATLALAGCGASQTTDTSWADIKAKGYFVLGLDDSFPPMGYRDDNNEIVGFDIDLARECAKKMGLTGGDGGIKLQPLVWDYIAEELNGKKVDVIWNGCTITDARKEKFNFTKPYMSNEQVVVVMANSGIQTLNDLAGKRLGIQGGSSAVEALEKNAAVHDSLAEVVEFSDNTKALMDLETNRLDAVAVDVVVFGEYNAKRPDVFKRLDEALGSEEFGVGVRKSDKTFQEELQKALDACMSDGTAQQIADKWLGKGAGALKK